MYIYIDISYIKKNYIKLNMWLIKQQYGHHLRFLCPFGFVGFPPRFPSPALGDATALQSPWRGFFGIYKGVKTMYGTIFPSITNHDFLGFLKKRKKTIILY